MGGDKEKDKKDSDKKKKDDKDKKEKSDDKHKSDKEKDKHKSDKEKDKHKSDKEKDKHKSDKDKKKDDKHKSDKDKKKDDKHKSDKDKKKDLSSFKGGQAIEDSIASAVLGEQSWKLAISKNLDNIIIAYEKIYNLFKDIDNYILKDAKSLEDFKSKIQKNIEDLPEQSKAVFNSYLNSL